MGRLIIKKGFQLLAKKVALLIVKSPLHA
jgi:hypothetical protein